jgi:hypothetical protein
VTLFRGWVANSRFIFIVGRFVQTCVLSSDQIRVGQTGQMLREDWQRRAYRRKCSLPVVLLVTSPHTRVVFGETLDVSMAGFALTVPENESLNEQVGFRLDVAKRVVIGLADVLSTELVPNRTGPGVTLVRCRFAQVSTGDRDALARFVLAMHSGSP